jgi:AraC-like DNA-binding protein
MVLSLSIENFWNLIGEAEADGLQLGYSIPASLGQGYYREIELSPEMTLSFYDYDFAEDIELTVPVHEHLVQCMVLTAGAWDCDIYPEFGRSCAYLSGSGMSMAYADRHFQHQRTTGIDIEFEPAFVGRLLGEAEQMALTRRRFLQQEDWKQSFFPTVTPAIQSLVHQIIHSPYQAATRRLHLQAKAMELLALLLDPVLADQGELPLPRLKSDTIDRLHQARAILRARLDDPPALLDLAEQVGMSERTLRRGFRELFQTTALGYLTQQRLIQAEQLLRQGNSVSEVARRVGYGHLGRFAAAFRRQFGITPSECLAGKRVTTETD